MTSLKLSAEVVNVVEKHYRVEDYRYRINPRDRNVTHSMSLEVKINAEVLLFSPDSVVNNLVQQDLQEAILYAIYDSPGYLVRLENKLGTVSSGNFLIPVEKVYKITGFQILTPETSQGYYGDCYICPEYPVNVNLDGLLVDYAESDFHLYNRLYSIIKSEEAEQKELKRLKDKYE